MRIFWNSRSNCAYSGGVFQGFKNKKYQIYTIIEDRIYYRRNFTENFKKVALYYRVYLLFCIFKPLENASIIGAILPIISKFSLSGGGHLSHY